MSHKDILVLMMFFLGEQTFVADTIKKKKRKKPETFCVSAINFVSTTNIARGQTGKHACVPSTMCPRLHKVCVLRMRQLFIWILIVTEYPLVFLKIFILKIAFFFVIVMINRQQASLCPIFFR